MSNNIIATENGAQLRSLITRIEKLEEEKKDISTSIREVFAEAKGAGFDVKVMKQVLKMRRKDSNERQEEQSLLELYCNALGMMV